METDCRYANEPKVSWSMDDFDSFLLWASQEQEVEDVKLLPRRPAWVKQNGRWSEATKRPVTSDEIGYLLNTMTESSSATAQVSGGEGLDFSHEVRMDRYRRRRFRGRATRVPDRGAVGYALTLRSIPGLPPALGELQLEEELLHAGFPSDGLVLVTGVMGTGKSTLMASMLQEINTTQPRSIITYEQPIEFDLLGIEEPVGPLAACEIPRDIRSFQKAPPDAARRAADVILIGESRDPQTMRGMLEVAEMGVAAYTTVHTQSVATTPTRIINRFPIEQQNLIGTTLLASLRLIIQQRLLPRADGNGRVAAREFLVFDDQKRHRLSKLNNHELTPALQEMVKTDGQTLAEAVQRRFEQKLITKDTRDDVLDNRWEHASTTQAGGRSSNGREESGF